MIEALAAALSKGAEASALSVKETPILPRCRSEAAIHRA